MYAMAGKCYDLLENRPKAKVCLVTSLRIDPTCVEALDYLVSHGLMSIPEKHSLYSLARDGIDYAWLDALFRFHLLDDINAHDSIGREVNSDMKEMDNKDSTPEARSARDYKA